MVENYPAEVSAYLFCGRVKFRTKTIKDSSILFTFGKSKTKCSFLTASCPVLLTCDTNGLRITTSKPEDIAELANYSQYNFTQTAIVPYGLIFDTYVHAQDLQNDLGCLKDWKKHLEHVTVYTSAMRTLMITTKDINCLLFFFKDDSSSFIQNLRSKTDPFNRPFSRINGIRHLKTKLEDINMMSPFSSENEWAAEVCLCKIGNDYKKFFKRKDLVELKIRNNPTCSNDLSQCFVASTTFADSIWFYTHLNGSVLLFVHKIPENLQTNAKAFRLDDLLSDSSVYQELFSNLISSVVTDHFKDCLSSSLIFWGSEDEAALKWLSTVSRVLAITADVVNGLLSAVCTPVLLNGNRSLCLLVGALAEICVCARSRSSIEALNRLIQKYFVSLGFEFRLGNKQNFLFLLFLDCLYQLMCQSPSSFNITNIYLTRLAFAFLSNNFFEFSFSSPGARFHACLCHGNNYRWFFPIEQHFSPAALRTFSANDIQSGTIPKPIPRLSVATTALTSPITYFPFKSIKRSHSEGNLIDIDDGDFRSLASAAVNPLAKFRRRVKMNIFNQRPASTFVQCTPLVLRKATYNHPLPSPAIYFANSSTDVIKPKFKLPCLRLWSDFILTHEFDFDSFDQY